MYDGYGRTIPVSPYSSYLSYLSYPSYSYRRTQHRIAVRAFEVRRDRHRRRSQRPDRGGVPGTSGTQGARARAPARRRRRRRHRRNLSRVHVLRLLVRRLAAAAGDHPRARSARVARPRDSPARRHVHADAERRLPLAGERSRANVPRDRAPLAQGRRGLRRVRPRDGRDGAVREAHPGDDAARSVLDASARSAARSRDLAAPVPRPARARSPQPAAAAHDERDRLPRSVVRDRRAQGRRCPRRASSARSSACDRPAPPTCCSTTTWATSTARSDRGACRKAARAACRKRSPAPRAPPAPTSA